MPAFDSLADIDLDTLEPPAWDRRAPPIEDSGEAWPADVADLWDRLPPTSQALISGPWQLSPQTKQRDKVGECVRALRAAGWSSWDADRLAKLCPHGLGSLAAYKNGDGLSLIAELYAEQKEAELRADRARVEAAEKAKTFGRLRILSVDDALNAPPRSYLLDGLLAPKELSVWWGKPKCGKSFLLLRLAYGQSCGKGMWGRKAAKVPVLYVAAEGEGGMSGRIRALHDTIGPAPDFQWIAQRVDLFDPEADLTDLIAATQALKAGLVVIDTLARTMGAGDENATRDMNVFVGNCDRLREEGGAHVAVVHHSGWDGNHARGSIALIGAADLVVKVDGEQGGPRSAKVEYCKEDETPGALGFRLAVTDLPPDAEGRPRTTCLAVEGDAPIGAQVSNKGRLNDEAATLLREVENSLASGDGRECSPEPGMQPCPTVNRVVLQAALIRRGWLRLPDPLPDYSPALPEHSPSHSPSHSPALPGTPRVTPRTGSNPERVPDSEHKRLYQRLTHLKMKGIIGFNRTDVWLARAPVAG